MHNLLRSVSGTAVIAAVLSASVASAQTAFTNTDIAEERNKDLLEAIADDAERDVPAFGNEGRPQGFTGSLAFRGLATTATPTPLISASAPISATCRGPMAMTCS